MNCFIILFLFTSVLIEVDVPYVTAFGASSTRSLSAQHASGPEFDPT